MSQGNTINDPESWMLCFWSSILLCQKMAQALWSLKPLRRPEWSSMILASVWPSPGLYHHWRISQWREDQKTSSTLLCVFYHNKQISQNKD